MPPVGSHHPHRLCGPQRLDSSDKVRANRYTRDRDPIYGSTGYDLIYVNDGDTRDRIRGGKGRDKCYVDAPREAVRGCNKVIVR